MCDVSFGNSFEVNHHTSKVEKPLEKDMERTYEFEATRIPQFKIKQSIGLQNMPEQTYDRYFVLSFRGGAHTGSIVQHHHVQGCAHDIRSVPESA